MVISDKEHKKNTKQFFVYSLIFICFIAVGIYVKQKGENENELLKKKGKHTIGNVINIRYSTRGNWIRYSYNVNGNIFEDVKNTYKKGIKVGQKYEVEYLPTNPEVNRINLDNAIP